MYITSLEAVYKQVLVWYAPVILCYLAWPILIRRRVYVVTAAVLCLTPVLTGYDFLGRFPTYSRLPDWFGPIVPLVVSLPETVMLLPGSLKGLAYMALPLGVFVGVVAWLLTRRFVTPGAGGKTISPDPPWGKRGVWAWTLLLQLQNLLLLLIATVGYVELWYLPFKFFARLDS